MTPPGRATENRASEHGEANPQLPENEPNKLRHENLPLCLGCCLPTAGERENKNERSTLPKNTRRQARFWQACSKNASAVMLFWWGWHRQALLFLPCQAPTKKRTQVWPHISILTLAKSRRGCDWRVTTGEGIAGVLPARAPTVCRQIPLILSPLWLITGSLPVWCFCFCCSSLGTGEPYVSLAAFVRNPPKGKTFSRYFSALL